MTQVCEHLDAVLQRCEEPINHISQQKNIKAVVGCCSFKIENCARLQYFKRGKRSPLNK